MVRFVEKMALREENKIMNSDVADGFSAYVHIPFCEVRCGYCDFNTYVNSNFGPGAGRADYADSVLKEIAFSKLILSRDAIPGKLKSIFFGGGTPTLLDVSQLRKILQALQDNFGFSLNIEITTEANPETITKEKLIALKNAGINRISFGMQSAVPRILKILDRAHTPGQIDLVVEWAKELDLNFSLDLIYGAPGENDAEWEKSVKSAIAYDPNHISCYALTVEPGTKMGVDLKHGKIELPNEDVLARRYEKANQLLESAGYRWYEISNWAKSGFECQHNLHYWRNDNWWGYGAGAHSHLNGTRFWNLKHPLAYAQKLAKNPIESPILEAEKLTESQRLAEKIMLGIRLREGVGVPASVKKQTIANFIADGLIDPRAVMKENKLILTVRGRLLADFLIRELWADL